MIVVHARTVGRLDASTLKATTGGTTEKRPERRRLKGVDFLIAVAAAEMVALVNSPIDLCVEAVCALGERKVGCVIVSGSSQRGVRV